MARGHTVHVLTTNVDGPGTSPVPLDTTVDLDGVAVRYFASPFRRIYWSPGMKKALMREIASYDVVHGHSIFLWPTMAAFREAARARVPYVISPRGMLVPELIEQKNPLLKRAWIRLVERPNFASASAIHFTSTGEMENARRTGLPLPGPFVIPNGTDLQPDRDSIREPRTLLYLGRINWKKGIDRLILAMNFLPDARLIIAGNDEEHYTAALPGSDRVTFIGTVSGAKKQELLRSVTMLVLPSLNENFGNVVLEAMAAGTPVIITPGVGLAPDVERAGAGLVVANEPATLAAAINELLAHPERQQEMGRNGRQLVAGRFTWQRVAEQMEQKYEQLRR